MTQNRPARHSIILPIFNESSVIPHLHARLVAEIAQPIEAQGDQVEFILVDDGSRDDSAAQLERLQAQDPARFRVLLFSRNFGHQTAITAGIDAASGDTITTIDADLQDPPRVVLEMIAEWRKGFDVVFARREKRESETAFKLWSAALFYRLLKRATQLEIPVDTGDFRLMSRDAARALTQLREQHRFVRGLAAWVGFKQTSVLYVRDARHSGETKYPLKKMFRLAWDAFTGFSRAPLMLATWLGFFSALVAVGLTIWALYTKWLGLDVVQGWTSLMIVILFFGGVQLLSIGILGEYIGRIFEQVKQRPLYLVRKRIGQFENPLRTPEGS